MAAKLDAELGSSTRLIEGGGGVFDVAVDGVLVYSKRQCGDKFPDADVLLRQLR